MQRCNHRGAPQVWESACAVALEWVSKAKEPVRGRNVAEKGKRQRWRMSRAIRMLEKSQDKGALFFFLLFFSVSSLALSWSFVIRARASDFWQDRAIDKKPRTCMYAFLED